jgi:eukaryotic translation initiation factor 2C
MLNNRRSPYTKEEPYNYVVELDKEEGRAISTKKNTFRVEIRQTKKLDLFPLRAYLTGQMSFDDNVLECINFIDHLIAIGPSEHLLQIKRSFYQLSTWDYAHSLGDGTVAFKGVYQSVRMAHVSSFPINVTKTNHQKGWKASCER